MSLKDVSEQAAARGHALDYATLSALERGRRRWNLDHVEAFCAACRVDAAALFVSLEEQGLLNAFRAHGVGGVLRWAAQRLGSE